MRKSGKVFGLAMTVGMPGIRRLGGNPHRSKREGRRQQVKPAVQGLGQYTKAVGMQPDGQLDAGKPQCRQQRQHGCAAFFAGAVVRYVHSAFPVEG